MKNNMENASINAEFTQGSLNVAVKGELSGIMTLITIVLQNLIDNGVPPSQIESLLKGGLQMTAKMKSESKYTNNEIKKSNTKYS